MEEKSILQSALCVGIDIGTTTVSAVVYDISNKEQLKAISVPHSSYVYSDTRYEQSPTVIIEKAEDLLYGILDSYERIDSIGITGQMHGIVYVDENGEEVSNLINWQDKRADEIIENGESVCQEIFRLTGERIFAGYGIATHYYNMKTDKVPGEAVGFCSIMDLFAMKICGINKALTHVSVASSFGMFDIKNGKFKEDKLSKLGIDTEFCPNVTDKSLIIGKCRGIPVSVPIGDNQASFLGSVSDNRSSLLVNIGTGSQVSAVAEYREVSGDIEVRPLIEGKYLICGSALCGGFAYNILEGFFRSYAVSMGMEDAPQYDVINKLAEKSHENGENCPDVDVSFLGKRSNPDYKGSIKGLDVQNFTPSALVLGVLKGMCNELYDLYKDMKEKRNHMVASGGAVEKNDILLRLLKDRFCMDVSLSGIKEAAAAGVCMFSAFCTGKIKYENGFSI